MSFVHAVGDGCAPLTTQMPFPHWPHSTQHVMLVLAMDTELRQHSPQTVGVGCVPLTTQNCTYWTLTTHFSLCWCWARQFDSADLIDCTHIMMLVMDTGLWPRSYYWTLTTQLVLNSDHGVLVCGVEYRSLTTHFSLTTQVWLNVGAGYGTLTRQFSFCWVGIINLYLT